MATEELFRDDSYLRECTATIVSADARGIVLDRTVFYPTGGGQPGDTGVLKAADGREWRVMDARRGEGGRIVHEEYSKKDGDAEFTILLADRFVVSARGQGVPIDQLRSAVGSLELAKLESMREAGAQK